MVRFTFEDVKNQAKDKGFRIEKTNKVYELWHPDYPLFGVSKCSNLNECMAEIISFNSGYYRGEIPVYNETFIP